jgi:hypothetical protein
MLLVMQCKRKSVGIVMPINAPRNLGPGAEAPTTALTYIGRE